MERTKKIELCISLLKPALSMIRTGRPYQFMDAEPLNMEARLDWVEQRIKRVMEELLNI